MMKSLEEMIGAARRQGASDLHLTIGMPPIVRVNGEILTLPGYEPMQGNDIRNAMEPFIDDFLVQRFHENWRVCFSRSFSRLGYFRVSLYKRAGNMEASIRLGITKIPSFEELGLPPVVEDFARRPSGIVLITGSTGAGKTTTFNAILDLINRERRCKFITIEDPIEFVHRPIHSLPIQQEVGTDVKSYTEGLNHALRQDPDVIGLGELRELDTIASALTAAETGHLVIATIHTNDAVSTVNRIIDVFPGRQQEQIRYQLAESLQAVINQRLLTRMDKEGRVLAYEIMLANEAVKNLIRENRCHMLQNVINTGSSMGMCALETKVKDLYEKGIIGYDTMNSCCPTKPNHQKRPEAMKRIS